MEIYRKGNEKCKIYKQKLKKVEIVGKQIMPFSGLCYLARCDLITERVWVYVKCRHCAINTAYKKKKTLLSYQYRRVHSVQKGNKKSLSFLSTSLCLYTECIQCAINLTPKGIYAKLSLSHQYVRLIGPAYARCDSGKIT